MIKTLDQVKYRWGQAANDFDDDEYVPPMDDVGLVIDVSHDGKKARVLWPTDQRTEAHPVSKLKVV